MKFDEPPPKKRACRNAPSVLSLHVALAGLARRVGAEPRAHAQLPGNIAAPLLSFHEHAQRSISARKKREGAQRSGSGGQGEWRTFWEIMIRKMVC